jgi:peptidoglycan/LPS O-acetylase OafA/YrhL
VREYRTDIDGLRAIAVLAVALFHGGFGFRGGYVGVDVFFVLSGFLITGLIARDLAAGTFSLAGFWERRVRRILPAATVMVLVTLAVGLLVLMPDPAAKLGRAAVAQTFMLANVYYAITADYFAGPSELLPLLHTWSLAVEEQFYVFFPLVLALAWRRGRRFATGTLVVLAFVSFAWSVHQIGIDADDAFYLLPSRAWELLLGSIVALAPVPTRVPAPLRLVATGGGLVAIAYACVEFRASTPFPGAAAAIPCLGTALVLWSESAGLTAFGRMLSFGPLRFVGLVSYSFYLWHWPALSLARCVLGEELSPIAAGSALAVSFGLAVLSWRFVETPFRRPSGRISRQSVLVRGALASVALAAVGAGIWLAQGLPARWDQETTRFVRGTKGSRALLPSASFDFRSPPRFGACDGSATEPTLVLWGDSHGLAASEVLAEAAERAGLCGAAFLRTGFPPVPGLWRVCTEPSSAAWNDRVLEWIESTPSIRHVVLASRWSVSVVPEPGDEVGRLVIDSVDDEATGESAEATLGRHLAALVERLEHRGIEVWIVKEVPYQDLGPEQVAIRASLGAAWDFHGVTREEHDARDAAVRRAFAALAGSRARIIDPSGNLFDESGASLVGDPDGSFYYDRQHLSPHGARRAIGPIADSLVAAASDTSLAAEPIGGEASP